MSQVQRVSLTSGQWQEFSDRPSGGCPQQRALLGTQGPLGKRPPLPRASGGRSCPAPRLQWSACILSVTACQSMQCHSCEDWTSASAEQMSPPLRLPGDRSCRASRIQLLFALCLGLKVSTCSIISVKRALAQQGFDHLPLLRLNGSLKGPCQGPPSGIARKPFSITVLFHCAHRPKMLLCVHARFLGREVWH